MNEIIENGQIVEKRPAIPAREAVTIIKSPVELNIELQKLEARVKPLRHVLDRIEEIKSLITQVAKEPEPEPSKSDIIES